LDGISIEAFARESMREAADSMDLLFSETDTLYSRLMPLVERGAGAKEVAGALNAAGGAFFADGVYIMPSGGAGAAHILNNGAGFRAGDTLIERYDWLRSADTGAGSVWGGPVLDPHSGRRVVYRRISPDENDSLRASVVFVYSTQKIYRKLLETGLNRFGLIYIIDDSTEFIAHPLDETRSLLELGRDYRDNTLLRLSGDVINGRPFEGDYRHSNSVTSKRCNEALYRLNATGWLLGLSIYDGQALESAEYQTTLRRGCIELTFLCGAFLILLCVAVQFRLIRNFAVFSCPLILLAMLICVVAAYNRYPLQSGASVDAGDFVRRSAREERPPLHRESFKWDLRRLTSRSSLDSFVADYGRGAMALHDEPVKIIPTGLYVYGADFVTPHSLRITGMIWQKFLISGEDCPEGIAKKYLNDDYDRKGAFFPGAYVWKMEEIGVIDAVVEGCPVRLYRWDFDIEMVQELSYSLYPFGKNEISMMLWSNDLDNDIILTPDLESYKQLYPTDKPGLHSGFQLKRWNVIGTFYRYAMESYLCSFGNADIQGINEYPELVYNISISRKFVDILIGKIIPLAIVLLLLFTIVFVRVTSDGFNNIIGCSGLFFVLMMDHINLRESVSSEEIMFLEFCYFISYLMLLFIAITSFDLFKRGESYNLKIDRTIKKGFWIFATAMMTTITAVYFW